jgi:hypothetical protein
MQKGQNEMPEDNVRIPEKVWNEFAPVLQAKIADEYKIVKAAD